MLKKAAQELFMSERHGPLLAVMGIVLPAKGHFVFIHREQSMIRDGNAMGVASQVLQHVLRSTKRRLSVHDPVLPEQSAKKGSERFLLHQGAARSVKHELVSLKSLPQASDKLATKHTAQDSDRQEELGP